MSDWQDLAAAHRERLSTKHRQRNASPEDSRGQTSTRGLGIAIERHTRTTAVFTCVEVTDGRLTDCVRFGTSNTTPDLFIIRKICARLGGRWTFRDVAQALTRAQMGQ